MTRLPLPIFQETSFHDASRDAVNNPTLRAALDLAVGRKDQGRRLRMAELRDPGALRDLAAAIKEHTLDHLDHYLDRLITNLLHHGGHVHFAPTAADANRIIISLAQSRGCQRIVKAKSMATEETQLNPALETAGLDVLETDLGEFIVQIAHEHPSHIVMPVIHKKAGDIGRLFASYFHVPFTDDPQKLAEMARVFLRQRFNQADMGVTGVNFALADTGSLVLCTNEGNGRMCTSRPKIHVALMGIEKVIPGLPELAVFLKLLARSASGLDMTQYTNIITGPRRPDEHDGPDELHLVLLDNGRSPLLSGKYREILRCIRCGACLNACPVYRKIGGHAYGSVLPGPIGSVLTPLLNGLTHHPDLPHASTLCGACAPACPVKIDLPKLLLELRSDSVTQHVTSPTQRLLFQLWTRTLKSPRLYQLAQRLQRRLLRLKSNNGWITNLPPPASGWTQDRDFPVPAQTFREWWKHRQTNSTDPPPNTPI